MYNTHTHSFAVRYLELLQAKPVNKQETIVFLIYSHLSVRIFPHSTRLVSIWARTFVLSALTRLCVVHTTLICYARARSLSWPKVKYKKLQQIEAGKSRLSPRSKEEKKHFAVVLNPKQTKNAVKRSTNTEGNHSEQLGGIKFKPGRLQSVLKFPRGKQGTSANEFSTPPNIHTRLKSTVF